jgi:hypothetical protein
MIDTVIRRHLEQFDKPGLTSVRPGVRITNGMLTHDPAIVISVRKKFKNLTADEMLPDKVEEVPVDVRPCEPDGSGVVNLLRSVVVARSGEVLGTPIWVAPLDREGRGSSPDSVKLTRPMQGNSGQFASDNRIHGDGPLFSSSTAPGDCCSLRALPN